MRALAALAVLASTAAAGPARADADSLLDHLGPREIAVGEAGRAGAIGALAVSLNPAGLPLTRELVFEGGYGYRLSDSASLVSVSACDSTNAMPGCFFYQYVNASPELDGVDHKRHAHTAGISLSRALGDRFLLGSTAKYFSAGSDLMDEPDASGFNWDAGLTVRLTDIVNVAAVGYNLWGKRSPQYPRAASGGVLLRPWGPLAVNFDAVWNLDAEGSTGRYGGGLEYFLTGGSGQVGYPLRAGVVHDVAGSNTYLSAGLGLATMKLGLDVGARRQVRGGDELQLIASLRVFGPRQESGGLE